jgi:hypothetical protein
LAFLDRRVVRRLLQVPLPREACNIRYLVSQPNGDLAYHEALIRFDCDQSDYLDLVRNRGMSTFAETGHDAHLPIDWSPAPEVERPVWWTPTPQTPSDAAGARVGKYGSIVAKWENGHAFVLIEDTGHQHGARRT